MTFAVFADGTANLPGSLLEGITLLPSEYTTDGVPCTYTGDIEHFDMHSYYERLRNGMVVRTSLLNTACSWNTLNRCSRKGRISSMFP